jgi:threonine aldolase
MARPRTRTLEELSTACTRFLVGGGPRDAASLLAQIPADTAVDLYGEGGVVGELEEEVAGLLGKERALFLPSGTMAQQATLRVHAERRRCSSVAFHPLCHLRSHEENAFHRLHGLNEVLVGSRFRPLEPVSLDVLALVKEPIAALLLELPQRDIGGHLPSFKELKEQTQWARDRGAAVHLDGARLWEAAPFYAASAKQSVRDVAALFDTVYVSFYKGLGALAGCCVAGDADVIDELALWRTRHGGRLYMLWPYAASALTALREEPRHMGSYFRRARAIAKAIREVDGIDVLPDEVRSPLMHVRVAATAAQMEARVRAIAVSDGVWTFSRPFVSEGTRLQRYEFQVGRATMSLGLDEIVAIFARLAGHHAR